MIEFEDDQCDWTCQCIYRDVGLIFRTNPLICRKNMLVGRNNGGQNCQIASQLRPFPKGSTDKELGTETGRMRACLWPAHGRSAEYASYA